MHPIDPGVKTIVRYDSVRAGDYQSITIIFWIHIQEEIK